MSGTTHTPLPVVDTAGSHGAQQSSASSSSQPSEQPPPADGTGPMKSLVFAIPALEGTT